MDKPVFGLLVLHEPSEQAGEIVMSRFLFFVLLLTLPFTVWPAETTLINRALNGEIAGVAEEPDMSADGSIIAFSSTAFELIGFAQDSNGVRDIYVYDVSTDTFEMVSVSNAGNIGDNTSRSPSISANGRYVAFQSAASNLVTIPNLGGLFNVYVHDRQTGITTLVSKNSLGQAVAGGSFDPAISADGRYIAYTSNSDQIEDSDSNGISDVFVYDRITDVNTKVSVATGGAPSTGASSQPAINDDGRYIAFASEATNFENFDTNNQVDIYRHDRQTNTTSIVSTTTSLLIINGQILVVEEAGSGQSFLPSISANGQHIAFITNAENLVDIGAGVNQIALKNMAFGAQQSDLELISINEDGQPGNASSRNPSISADAQYVSFFSDADNLIDDDTNNSWDVFLYNRSNSNMERISVGDDNTQGIGNGQVFSFRVPQRLISDDGRYVAFETRLANLVADDVDDENNVDDLDVFIRDRGEPCDNSFAGATRTLPSSTWLLASLPCVPPSSQNTVGDILGDDIEGALGTTWAVFMYDPTLAVPNYVAATLDTPLFPGQGFWIQHNTGVNVTLDMPEGSRQVTGRRSPPSGACTSSDGCFEVPLSGVPNTSSLWNMIGNPYLDTNPVAFNDLRVSTSSGSCAAAQGCTMAEAADELVVFNRFFHYDEAGYSNREAGSTLAAWEGYWVPELSFSEFNNTLIRFPR